MNEHIKDELHKLHQEFVGDILSLAEIGLTREQFRQFKKRVFKEYHERLIRKTSEIIESANTRSKQE
jgi:hypothetical protein